MIDSIQIDNIGDELMTWQNFISFCIGFVSSLLVEHLVRKVRMPSLKLAKHISLCGYHRFAIKACNNSWFKQLHNAQITITLVSDFLDKTTSELIACEGNFGTLDKRILCRHNRFASCDINFSEERMAKMLRGAYLNVVFEGCRRVCQDIRPPSQKRQSTPFPPPGGCQYNLHVPQGAWHYRR